jgi:hypothetical protein
MCICMYVSSVRPRRKKQEFGSNKEHVCHTCFCALIPAKGTQGEKKTHGKLIHTRVKTKKCDGAVSERTAKKTSQSARSHLHTKKKLQCTFSSVPQQFGCEKSTPTLMEGSYPASRLPPELLQVICNFFKRGSNDQQQTSSFATASW